MSLVSIDSLNITIGDTTVCRDLTINIRAGENWAILGMNGSGKTTLLHTLAGLHAAQSGEIFLNGKPLFNLSRRVIAQQLGLLMQHQEDHFPGTVLETVLIGRHPHLKSWQWESDSDKHIAIEALKHVGLTAFENRSILTLSGGERQRVALATLLVQQTAVRLLDEPVNHLDIHQQHEIMKTLSEENTGKATLFVLHDINLATRYCDHALLLFGNGKTLHGSCTEVLTETNLSQLYQHPLQEISHQDKRWFIAN
ncbi:MAG: ABC transporter ATP-binding protein [Gammaproteobacteria bacterium]|nr:ABC transporter ATP-binding protein [Gammaproteobacteria bacterium]